jgi:hypothetical protein
MTEEVLPDETAVRVESGKEKVIKNRQVDADLDPGQGHGQDLDQRAPDAEDVVAHRANQNPVLFHQ